MSPEPRTQIENAEKIIARWLIENRRTVVKLSELKNIVGEEAAEALLQGRGSMTLYKVADGEDPAYIVSIYPVNEKFIKLAEEVKWRIEYYGDAAEERIQEVAAAVIFKSHAEGVIYEKVSGVLAWYHVQLALKYKVYDDVRHYGADILYRIGNVLIREHHWTGSRIDGKGLNYYIDYTYYSPPLRDENGNVYIIDNGRKCVRSRTLIIDVDSYDKFDIWNCEDGGALGTVHYPVL